MSSATVRIKCCKYTAIQCLQAAATNKKSLKSYGGKKPEIDATCRCAMEHRTKGDSCWIRRVRHTVLLMKTSSDLVSRSRSCAVLPGRLDGPMSSTLRSLARFNSGGHSSETEAVDGDIMDAVIRTATASMDRRPLRDRRRPSPANSASSASRDSVERQKCQFSTVSLLTNKNAGINLTDSNRRGLQCVHTA